MESGIKSIGFSAVAGAVLGASCSAGVWCAAYGIWGGQGLAILLLSHALVGALLGILLVVRGRVDGSGGFFAATTLLLTGPIVLGVVSPLLGVLTRTGRISLFLIVAGLVCVAAIGGARPLWGKLLLGLATAAGLASLLLLPQPTSDLQPMRLTELPIDSNAPLSRVAILGIDGGDWRVLDPMIQAGELPAIARLVERGTRGVLNSIEPMYSPVVWTTIFSGMTPEEHGIRDWYSATAANRKVPLLWEIVGASDEPAITLNVPGSWPTRPFPGAIVAGFPMPRLMVSATEIAGQFLGRVVTSSNREGIVPNVIWSERNGHVPLGREQILASTLVRHPLLESAIRRRWLTGTIHTLDLTIDGSLSDEGPLQLNAQGQDLSLRRGEWSSWIDINIGSHPAFLRIRRLQSGDLYVTPPFQSPRSPRFNFIAGDVTPEEVAPDNRYVVEGVGWKAVGDSDIRTALAEHLEQVSALQFRAAQQLAERPWTLFSFIFTLTDRISHGYWQAEGSGRIEPGDQVREAYRIVDRDLGLLLAQFGNDVTVFIVSDHGFQSDPVDGGGTHRADGIFIASGPGIRARPDPLELSVYDVAPTVIAGLGLPVAQGMSNPPLLDLFDHPPSPQFIDTYGQTDSTSTPDRIDESTEEQLRSLGYIE